MTRATCPNDADHKTFATVAHVAEKWKVDEKGNFLANLQSLETVASPDPENTWTCTECGAEAEVTHG